MFGAPQYQGIAIDRKNEATLRQISDAMRALIADGGYTRIAAKWGLGEFAVSELMVDGAGRVGSR
jgi:hypothetical protein